VFPRCKYGELVGVAWTSLKSMGKMRWWSFFILLESFMLNIKILREIIRWIRMTRTAQQDARRSGKEDAGHSLFWKNASSDFTGNPIAKLERGLVGTRREGVL